MTVLSLIQMLKSGKQLKCIGPLERLVGVSYTHWESGDWALKPGKAEG